MTHVRKQIRDLAVTVATGLTTTGARVFSSRLYPLAQTDLPCWIVSTDDNEEVEYLTLGVRQQRDCLVQFDGYARATEGVENTLDAMTEELETVMLRSAFAALAKDVKLDSTDFDFAVDELDNQFGIVTLVFRVRYHTDQGAPGVAR